MMCRVRRAFAATFVALGITVVLALVLGGLWQTFVNGGDALSAFVVEAPRVLVTGGTVSLVLLLIGLFLFNLAARRSSNGASFWVNVAVLVLSVLIGSAGGFLVGLLIGAAASAFAWSVAFFAILAGVWIFFAGLIALAITHFAIFRTPAVAQ